VIMTPYTALAERGKPLPGVVTSTGDLKLSASVKVVPSVAAVLEKLYVVKGQRWRQGQAPFAL